jgi:hypothetical protein
MMSPDVQEALTFAIELMRIEAEMMSRSISEHPSDSTESLCAQHYTIGQHMKTLQSLLTNIEVTGQDLGGCRCEENDAQPVACKSPDIQTDSYTKETYCFRCGHNAECHAGAGKP